MNRIFRFSVFIFLLLNTCNLSATKPYNSIKVEAKRWVKGDNNQPWKMYDTRIVNNMNEYVQTTDTVNKYGSCTSKRVEATGFFHTIKLNNRWWIVDPDGYLNIQKGINGVRKGTSERNQKAFMLQYGSDEKWMEKTFYLFKNTGINATGAWSTDSVIRLRNNKSSGQKLSYTVNLRLMAAYGKKRGGTYQLPGNIGFPNQTIFVFDKEFTAFCDSVLLKEIKSLSNDQDLFGYFSDNELPFGKDNLEGYLTLKNESDPGRLAAEKWLNERDIAKNDINDSIKNEFAGYVASEYFRIVKNAIRKADPNHMYLGSRLHGNAKFIPQVLQSASANCDIVSINYYGVWTPLPEHLQKWNIYLNKPFLITEFYTKAMDAGLANTTGAGYTVHTQTDRGYAYQDFCLALLESGQCVGWHYFKYQDNDPLAKGVDPSNIDSNKGILNNDYIPYNPLIINMKQLNSQVYSLIRYFDK